MAISNNLEEYRITSNSLKLDAMACLIDSMSTVIGSVQAGIFGLYSTFRQWDHLRESSQIDTV